MATGKGKVILRWLVRILLGLVGLVVLAIVIGAICEQVIRARIRHDFPPPGRMVDVGGGRMMHIDCRGHGFPTVVLEAGLDTAGSLSWSAVQDKIATTTRVCAYDRAGVSWSQPKSGVHDADAVNADLHALLRGAHEEGPYVLAGHSLGGPYIMNYTRHWPSEVAGLVFVDASHPDQVERLKGVIPSADDPKQLAAYKLLAGTEWMGWARLLPQEGQPNEPGHAVAASKALAPTSLGGALAEQESIRATFREAGRLRTLGDRPIVVLTAMAPFPAAVKKQIGMSDAQEARMHTIWKSLQDDEASWSTRSRHTLVPNSTHYIQFGRPDLVIAAVNEVVAQVRTDQAKAQAAAQSKTEK
jgi:pimeloyl-ACP methyl ester carboxylesterase